MQTVTFYKAFSQKRKVLPQDPMWELLLPHPVLWERKVTGSPCGWADPQAPGSPHTQTWNFPTS